MMFMGFFQRRGKKTGDRIEPVLEQASAIHNSPHERHVHADPFAFQAAHKRLAWMFRISAGMNIALVMTAIVLGQTISVLVPLKKTEYALVRTYEPDDKLYRIEPISEDVEGFELLLESMAKRYVKLVLELDSVTQDERMVEASRMTDRVFSERFKRDRIKSGAIREALDRGLTREIIIESVDRIESFGNDHKLVVDFIRVDRERGAKAARKRLRAYLSMTTRPQEVRKEDRYTNPLGIVVLDMTLKERSEK